MSGSGNMMPTSRTMIRPSTSTQAQLRPISPRPPRKTIRTGAARGGLANGAAGPHGQAEVREHHAGHPLELGRRAAERQPALPDGQAERPAGGLGRHRVGEGLRRFEVVGLDEHGVQAPGPLDVARQVGGDHVAHLAAHPVGGHADHPDRPHGQQRQRQRVVAAVELEGVGGLHQEAGRSGHVARRVLDGHHVRYVAHQGEDGLGGDPAPGAHRDVVEDDRQVGGGGHRGEVGPQAGLGRPVVVRGDHQHAVDPGVGGRPGGLDRVGRVVGPGAGQHRDGHRLGHHPPQVGRLGVGQDRALPGRPGQHQAVAAVVDQPAGQLDGGVEVDRPGVVERRDHGRDDPPETWRLVVTGHRRQGTSRLRAAPGPGPAGSPSGPGADRRGEQLVTTVDGPLLEWSPVHGGWWPPRRRPWRPATSSGKRSTMGIVRSVHRLGAGVRDGGAMGTGRHRRRLAGGALLLGSIGLIGVAQPASAAATPGVVGVLPTVTSPVYDPGVGVYAAGLASVDLINGLSVTSSTALPFATGAIGVDTGANDVYALNQPLAKKGEIGIVHNMALATTIVVKGAHPTALAVDSTAHLAYVTEITASAGQVAVLDGTSVVGTVPLAAQPYAVDVDPSSGLAYVACGNNTVVVLHGTTVVGSVAVPNLPVDVVADPVNGDAYVESLPGPAATLTVLHGTTVAGSIPLGANVSNVAVDTTSGSVYVGDAVDDTSVSVVNGTTLTTTVELGAPSTSITVDPAAGVAYVQVGTDLVPISGGVAGPPFPLPVPSLVSVSGL